MSIENPAPAEIADKPQPRVRRSFKLLLLLVAIAVISWYGLRLFRARLTEQILVRHDAVLAAIIDKVVTPPEGTSFKNSFPREDLEKLLGRTWPSETVRRDAILEFDSPFRTSTTGVMLDITQSLADDTSPAEVAARLVEHYTSGLGDAGLERVVSGGGANATSVWKSPGNDLDVWIDVNILADARSAEVRIIFIDSQQLTLW